MWQGEAKVPASQCAPICEKHPLATPKQFRENYVYVFLVYGSVNRELPNRGSRFPRKQRLN